jgi:hydroxymethylbilane synthase
MKDMPTLQPEGLVLDCYLPREDVRDAFVSDKVARIAALAAGQVVGTSSLRRRAQLLHRRPDLRVVEFRGNVQTRLRKLAEGVADCTFLAMAGLNRLGMAHVARSAIAPERCCPPSPRAPSGSSGARATPARPPARADPRRRDRPAPRRRARLPARLDGSCETPIAGLAELDGALRLRGEILRPDGSEALAEEDAPIEDGAELGRTLAARLLDRAPAGFFDWRAA